MWRGRGSGGCCLPASDDLVRNKDFIGNESAASRPAGEEGAGRGFAGGRERSPVAFAPNARRPDLAFAVVERRGDDARFRVPPRANGGPARTAFCSRSGCGSGDPSCRD